MARLSRKRRLLERQGLAYAKVRRNRVDDSDKLQQGRVKSSVNNMFMVQFRERKPGKDRDKAGKRPTWKVKVVPLGNLGNKAALRHLLETIDRKGK